MALFGKKTEPFNPPKTAPTEQVLNLRSRGITNDQIIQALQRDGYNSQQIFDALTQADMQAGSPREAPMPTEMPPSPMEQPMMQPAYESTSREEIEEVAEAIIDEKWDELVKNINKIIEWKNKVEAQTNRIQQEITDLKAGFANLQKSIIGKIGEYDKTLIDVGTEVRAMEKVFNKILPAFTSNVNELSRIVQKTKSKPKG